ncbi:hypothetical protein BDV41DRAFT_567571 [Aspergillus transmontanensis]|uniref:Uncharacterized protein n=1 Tax=Aspergillus transmontanensis TaxID=1034304 RepID=A0A5N6VLH9_9EURO|nr:hypothetical protein BDV41DRAFT_567571 [Aspergillus transmontanensis]
MLLFRSQICSSRVLSALSHITYVAPDNQAGGQVWLSGQIPVDAQGNLIKGSTAIFKQAGSGLDLIVKVVVNACVMSDFASVYNPAFPHRPARSMVEVCKLPAGVDIQVGFIAVI